MYIADSQVHVWPAESPDRPWPKMEHKAHRREPFLPSDLIREMDAAGVYRAVIVPPTWEGFRNDVGLQAAHEHPDRLTVMGRFDFDDRASRDKIATWLDQPGMLGLRFTFARPAVWGPLVEERIDWVWEDAEKYDVPIMMAVCPPEMHHVERIVKMHPGLRITIDHMARQQLNKKDEEAFGQLDKLLALAKYPNVAVKASGMPEYTDDTYPYRALFGYIRRTYDAFGPQRLFWGTDLTKLPCTYRQSVTMFTEEIDWLTAADLDLIMGRALCEWHRWAPPTFAELTPAFQAHREKS